MWVKGGSYRPRSVDDARARGIDVVYQDLALIEQLSVYHNLFLNREKVRAADSLPRQPQDAADKRASGLTRSGSAFLASTYR